MAVRPMASPADLAAYRVVREALTNTLKHARADSAEVNLRDGPATLVLEVTDDGPAPWFRPASAGRPGDGSDQRSG